MKFSSFGLLLPLIAGLPAAAAPQALEQDHNDRITYVSFLADSKTLLAGSEDFTISLWDMSQAQPAKMWQQLSAFKAGPSTKVLSLSSDGALLARAGTAQGSAEVWSIAKRVNTRTIAAHRKPVIGVALAGDGSTLVTYCQDELKVWHVATGKLLFGIKAPALYSFRAAAASRDGKLIAVASSDKVVSLFNSTTGKLVHQFGALPGQLNALSFSPDSSLVAVAGDGDQGSNVHMWKVADYSVVPDILGPPQAAHSIAFSADGRLLAVGAVSVRVWDMSAKKAVQDFSDHERIVDTVAFSPDGAYLASGGEDWKVIVWKLAAAP